MTDTTRDDALLPVVEDLVERQRQILAAIVTGRPPSRDSVQAVLLGLRGVVTKLRNGAAEADATTPDCDTGFKETARNLNPDAEIQGNEHVPGVEVVKAAMDRHPFPTPTRVLATSAVEALIRAGWHSPRMVAAMRPADGIEETS